MSEHFKCIIELKKQYQNFIKDNYSSLTEIGGYAEPIDNFLHWMAYFKGPKKTPYQDGIFYIEIKFPEDYPNSIPEVQMRTPIYHPNIDSYNGHIVMTNFFKYQKIHTIEEIVFVVFQMLALPNFNDSYYGITKNEEKARKFREKYAISNQTYDWENSWNKRWAKED